MSKGNDILSILSGYDPKDLPVELSQDDQWEEIQKNTQNTQEEEVIPQDIEKKEMHALACLAGTCTLKNCEYVCLM